MPHDPQGSHATAALLRWTLHEALLGGYGRLEGLCGVAAHVREPLADLGERARKGVAA